MPHQVWKHGCVTGLPGPDQRHQWTAVPVDKMVDLAAPAAPGPADRMVRRLVEQIRVVRPSPLWNG